MTRLDCPCGQHLEGEDDDELVAVAQRHLEEKHPDLRYGRDEILFLAY